MITLQTLSRYMPRFFILSLFFVILPLRAEAQSSSSGEGYWSAYAGVVMSRMVGSDYVTAYHTGFAVGASYSLRISELSPFYFEAGSMFVRRGGVDYGYIGGYGEVYNITSYNIELPFSFHFRIRFSEKVALSLALGGYFSTALSGRVEGDGCSFNPYRESNIYMRDCEEVLQDAIFHRFDAGPQAGFLVHVSNFVINFNSCMGLVNIFQDKLPNQGYDLTSKSLNFLLGYIF